MFTCFVSKQRLCVFIYIKMSSKPSCVGLKNSCDKLKRNSLNKKVKIKLPKKVVISKKWHVHCSHEVKSAGVINAEETVQPKKTTKSESKVSRCNKNLDFCMKCGDTDEDIITAVSEYSQTTTSFTSKSNKTSKNDEESTSSKSGKNKKVTVKEYYKNELFDNGTEITNVTSKFGRIYIKNKNGKTEDENEVVREYYRNDKFADLYDSMHDFDNGLRNFSTLDTITEVNEKQTLSGDENAESVYIIESSDEDANVKELKEFRERNYFECHSARTRVKSKGSVTSLKDHKCSFRFYLNDRLFPVAVNSDHNDTVRCVECHLPLQSSNDAETKGTIQAKVKLGSDTTDMVILLPAREPLIIQQKRKEKTKNDVMYFGVIKLDQNSTFSRFVPDSLALKYQKGFRKFDDSRDYRYDKVDKSDVIFV